MHFFLKKGIPLKFEKPQITFNPDNPYRQQTFVDGKLNENIG